MSTVVATRYGRIGGTVDQSVLAFRGVPYARPPVGTLRFRPPEPPEVWAGLREAREFGPAAPQGRSQFSAFAQRGIESQSEDCLTLNIWTPALHGTPRPVLVWIHGGRFIGGSASLPDTNGRRLARRGDAVVVTVEYRLGALGFLDLSEAGFREAPQGNLGLQDLLAALEWIRDEIDAFGGSPDNVTVFGSDTGGTCVACLLAMPRARGLFHRAIIQSGFFAVHDRTAAARVGELFLDSLEPEHRNAVQSAPLSALLRAQDRCIRSLETGPDALAFAPVVDGELLPVSPLEAIRGGAACGIPLLVGSNLDETRLFGFTDPSFEEIDERRLVERLEHELPARSADSLARRAIALYRERAREDPGPTGLMHAIESDRLFRSSACRLAELQSRHEPNTYAYVFHGSATHAALHGVEVAFVFGTLENHSLRNLVGKSHETTALARRIQDAWIAFAQTGNPSHRGLGPWPAYAAPERPTMILGDLCTVEPAAGDATLGFWHELEPPIAHV